MMNIEKHFSESEIKYMNKFLKRYERWNKSAKARKWIPVFAIIFFGITALLCLLSAVDYGISCGMYSFSEVMSFYSKHLELDRTYTGREVLVLYGIDMAILLFCGMIIILISKFLSLYVWKERDLLHKCWQLLSSQK